MQGFHQRVLCHFISLLLLNASRFSELFHLLFKYLSSILKKKYLKTRNLFFEKPIVQNAHSIKPIKCPNCMKKDPIFRILWWLILIFILNCSEAEFSVSICSTPKLICSSDDGVPRLLITENNASYKSNLYKKQDDVNIISV